MPSNYRNVKAIQLAEHRIECFYAIALFLGCIHFFVVVDKRTREEYTMRAGHALSTCVTSHEFQILPFSSFRSQVVFTSIQQTYSYPDASSRPLPSIDLEVLLSSHKPRDLQAKKKQRDKGQSHLREIRRDNRPIGELSTCQRLQRLTRRIRVVVLDEDFTDASRLPATTAGAGHFDFENRAIFLAFLFDILDDFCRQNQHLCFFSPPPGKQRRQILLKKK